MSFFKKSTPKLSTPKPLLSNKQHTKVALKKNEAEIERLEKLIIDLSKEKEEKEYKNKSWYNKVGNFVSSTIGLNTTEDTDKQKKLKKKIART